ncbi:hypothetical protein [Selenomonas ruminantium]|uniref:hypothetical protein n=1 Tax=Selenomonas ruminantium TaxID=971 RepID=UPI0009328933|nr:hypothetical protein [Selenomonas ruminantium]
MHDEVKKSIAQGKGSNLRYFFVDSFNIDPTFASYHDDFEYCRQHDVFEPQRRLTPFRTDERSWDKEYWLNLKADLQDNFSEERMLHMINVAKVIYKQRINSNKQNNVLEQKKENIFSNTYEDNKKYRIEKILPQDDPELKQEAELKKAREEFARQEEAKKKALARPNVPNKYVGGQNVKKSQGIPLLPISIIIALVIVVLLLLLK